MKTAVETKFSSIISTFTSNVKATILSILFTFRQDLEIAISK